MTSAAITAAAQASKAATELLLHATEDGLVDAAVGDLAEALSLSIDLHLAAVEECDVDYRRALEGLRGQIDAFIERWVA